MPIEEKASRELTIATVILDQQSPASEDSPERVDGTGIAHAKKPELIVRNTRVAETQLGDGTNDRSNRKDRNCR
jgi:hypothetical protein